MMSIKLIKTLKLCCLELVESDNVDRLDVVLECGDLLLDVVDRDELVEQGGDDLQLLDAVADGDELGCVERKKKIYCFEKKKVKWIVFV